MPLFKVRDFIQSIESELIELRHRLHQIPEPGLHLPHTAARIESEIRALNLELHHCQEVTGMMAVLRGKHSGDNDQQRPLVLLRADMDALPIREQTNLEWASTNGNMHACGHDVHMAGLVGAMRALSHFRDELQGDVIFMFQSGEEGHNGAKYMIDEGLLEAAGRKPDHAYGLHVWSARYPSGFIGTRPGAMMASSDTVNITVKGRGGHGSAPHETLDPIPVLAHLVTQVQVMVAREFDIFDPVVATCGHIKAGTTNNVIPDEAYAEFTLRAFSPQARTRLQQRIVELANDVAKAHQMSADVELIKLYPVTVNDTDEVAYARGVVDNILPNRWQLQKRPMAAAEDFSRVLQEIPGCFIGVSGVEEGADHRQLPFNHSVKAHFSDSVIADCATVLASLAYNRVVGRE